MVKEKSLKESEALFPFKEKKVGKRRSLRSILPLKLIEEFKEAVELDDLFQSKLDSLWKSLKITPEEVEKKLAEPGILSDKEWEKIQKKVGLLEKELVRIVEPQKELKATKERRQKIGKGERRKWIPVR